ncbi:hypothetical protein KQH42_07355 [Streptomyces sp. CHA1]|uniref:hypothetical protein n=1 Tax=Streptomyces TaxID=1883 RepID=UPI001BFBFFDA|nr:MULTISPECIES: hypothetical protein [unclassified Streptomyces]MBT3157343.1 hypothetical protein [Streptomyces sp. G11C]MCO6700332.1 hypothetical protein [Streptomyces sp. CHB9.2]MCO6706468.1 hypothetical protein [Streptomyces sp. CHA3]MCO6712210.1 hypothetical protein [Streptomyces sp. CHB19.2]MCO6718644.1 hypothetical protein [Streptomyces sp. Vc714c-19]
MTVRSAWLLPQGQTREDTRLAPVSPVTHESPIRVRDGVLPGGAPFAATGAGAMQLQIGAGRAYVQGTDAQGAYPIANDGPITLTFTDGDAQFGRIDAVVVRVLDALFDEEGQNLARIEIVEGEPDATPTAPTLPPASLRLWDVAVPAGTSAGVGGINWASALADRRRYTTAAGGIIPRGWGLGFDGAYDGQYRDNGSVLERWSAPAGEWQTYRAPRRTESTTTGFVVSSGYTLTSFTARRNPDAGLCSFYLDVSRKGAQLDVPAAGNVNDETVGTLPSGWRPIIDADLSVSDGYGEGTARLTTSGVLTLRTWSGNGSLRNDRSIKASATFMLP